MEKEPMRDRLKIFTNLSPMNSEEMNMNEIWKTIEIRGVKIKGEASVIQER